MRKQSPAVQLLIDEGAQACRDGVDRNDCPFPLGQSRRWWRVGHNREAWRAAGGTDENYGEFSFTVNADDVKLVRQVVDVPRFPSFVRLATRE